MYFGKKMSILENNTFYLTDIYCDPYKYQGNVYIEPYFPNIDVLAKIPKDFFIMANNLGENTGDGFNFTFKNALFIRGGY
jgi:hypothetical protein